MSGRETYDLEEELERWSRALTILRKSRLSEDGARRMNHSELLDRNEQDLEESIRYINRLYWIVRGELSEEARRKYDDIFGGVQMSA